MIAEKLNNRQHMLKYGANIKTNYVYKNFMEVLSEVGLPKEMSQSRGSKTVIIESLTKYTVYERIGQKWIFKENHYGEVKEFLKLEEGEVLIPYDDNEIYYISNFGRVWNKKNKDWLKNHENQGRYKVNMYNKQFILSRIVAQTFIPNPDNKPEVNHKDENPANNRADNLEWMTRKENNNYGTRIQRAMETRMKKHPNSGFNKGVPVSDEIKQKRAQTIKEKYPDGWGSWNKGKKHSNNIRNKEKAITKIKELILQYDISIEEIFN